MDTNEKIKEGFALLNKQKAVTITAKVVSVDEDNAVCVADIGNGLEIDVRLKAIEDENDNGFIYIPVVGSNITILRIGPSDDFLAVGFTTYTKILIKFDAISFEINQNGVIFNEAAKSSFMPDINQLVAKINDLESELNTLKTVFGAGWVVAAQDGGAALKTAAATWAGQVITPTTVNDVKDDKIQN